MRRYRGGRKERQKEREDCPHEGRGDGRLMTRSVHQHLRRE